MASPAITDLPSNSEAPKAQPRLAPKTLNVGIWKDPLSAATHLLGFLGAVVGACVLVVAAAPDRVQVTSVLLYGLSLVLLFLASTLYHFLDLGPRGNEWLRRFDHGAIFLLIAGTYIPALLHLLEGTWRIVMMSLVVVFAAVGVVFKMVWIRCPNALSTAIYVVMGWLLLIPGHIILPALSWEMMFWIFGGGVLYTGGAVIDVVEKPNPWPGYFGHHEVWHLFVLGGAAFHYIFTAKLLALPYAPF
jgi:hemolysin III